MFVIVKTVAIRYKYYYNHEKVKWEGLKNNATVFNAEQAESQFNILIAKKHNIELSIESL